MAVRTVAALAAIVAAVGVQQPTAAQSGASPALSGRAVQALAWFGGTAYAGTDAGLFRLTSSGWTAVSAVPSTRKVNALAVEGATLVAGTDTGAIRSGDGAVWTAAGLNGQSVDSLSAQGGVLLAGTGHEGLADGLAVRSDDGGATWAPATTLPAAERMPGAAVQAVLAPAAAQPAWAGTAGSGALRSSDGRGGWSDASAGLGSRWLTSLWRDPASLTVLAGTDDGLYQRGAGSTSWTAAPFPQQDPWVEALATATSGAPLAGTYDGAVYQRSGAGWTALGTGLPSILSLLAVPADQGGGVVVGSFDGAACLGCRSTLGAAAAPASPRAGATPLPPVAARPGASSVARAAGATPSGVAGGVATPSAAADQSAAAAAAPGGGGGGLPAAVWVVVALLLAASAGLTAWGIRRSRA
jgi:ligand-binding sensor domain-containing protein